MPGRVLITTKLPGDPELWLAERGWEIARTESLDEIDGLICVCTDRFDADRISSAPKLRAISVCAVGYDNVDVEFCRSRKIAVAHTPEVLTDSTADLTMALILAVTRRTVEGDAMVRENRFSGWKPDLLLGRELRGLTLGIFGLGRIGEAVAIRARAFGMNVIGLRRGSSEDELLAESDVISIHAPLTPETRHFFNAKQIARMKRGAYLINTSRGPIIDESALADALESGYLAGAALDVFEREPEVGARLLRLRQVVLAPHIGSATVEARERMALLAASNLDAMLSGQFGEAVLIPGSYRG